MLPRYSSAIPATVSPLSPMRARRRDRRDFPVGVRRFLLEDADHDGRDVVVAPVDIGFLNQGIDDSLGFCARKEQLLDPPVVDHSRQSVAGKQKGVADSGSAIEYIGLDLVGHPNTAGDDVALWMTSRLLRSEKPCVHLLLNERVVFGELAHLAVTHEIDP